MAEPKSVLRINNATATSLGLTDLVYDVNGAIVVNCDYGDDLLPSQAQFIAYSATAANTASGILPPKRGIKP